MIRKITNENIKGITLVSLVVTIVVLLILAGTTIANMVKDNGIIDNANESKNTTEIHNTIENIRLDLLKMYKKKGKKNISETEVEEVLKKYGDLSNEPELIDRNITTKNKHIIPVKDIGIYVSSNNDIIIPDEGGIDKPTTNPDVPPEEQTKPRLDYQWDNPIIPTGYQKKDEGEAIWTKMGYHQENIDKGLIIVDNKGNEFVWVPIKDKNIFLLETPYAYRDDYREFNRFSGIKFNNSQDFKNHLTQEKNQITESIKKYGGFYIGRYESSTKEYSRKYLPESKPNKQSETGGTRTESNENTWYGLYSRQNAYNNYNINANVKGTMIWGKQYDEVINWIKSTGINETVLGSKRNTTRITGSNINDKICNIYDLIGNSNEWTVEGKNENVDIRYARGGNKNQFNSLSSKSEISARERANLAGTRLVLIISPNEATK